jgi:hypothetical protein
MPCSDGHGPWNPGIQSQMPRELRHLATVFRPENVYTGLAAARELHGLTGLELSDLVAFRPQRLALHEVLVRVTADFAVPDGSKIEDLGLNFREMARRILARHVEPLMSAVIATHEYARRELGQHMDLVLSRVGRRWGPEEIAQILRAAAAAGDSAEVCSAKSVARVMSGLFATHGQAWGSLDLIKSMALDMAGNEYGSACIGSLIEPWLKQAASVEGYKLLPRQERPVVINTKGASASGKSTLRPLQKKLAGDIGMQWSDFALISPDIWRKQLLDYSSLGAAYKYAGACTSEELQIIDQKLDRYMARKHLRGEMSHLLIDRFRFDSFAPDSDEAGSNLLTRFGQSVYLFFMITPPELLVERAWNRGLEFGRYKAVDDTLAHAVEAYSGIPDVFFTWILRSDKRILFEFLDNTVQFGERPRTVAFGDNDTFNLLDVKGVLDIERYARVNVEATCAENLYADPALLAAEKNVDFLKRCVKGFRWVNFADQSSGRVYLRIEFGRPTMIDAIGLRAALANANTLAGVRAVAPAAIAGGVLEAPGAEYLYETAPGGDVDATEGASAVRQSPTLGQWATNAARSSLNV